MSKTEIRFGDLVEALKNMSKYYKQCVDDPINADKSDMCKEAAACLKNDPANTIFLSNDILEVEDLSYEIAEVPPYVKEVLDVIDKNKLVDWDDINKEIAYCILKSDISNYTKWVSKNPVKYMIARIDGYTAKEEQFYLKIVDRHRGYLATDFKNIGKKADWLITRPNVLGSKTKFTMAEIETYLPQFKPFAVKVGDEDGCDD